MDCMQAVGGCEGGVEMVEMRNARLETVDEEDEEDEGERTMRGGGERVSGGD